MMLPNDLIKEMHPDALAIIPMGRSTMVIELPPAVVTSDAFYDAEDKVRGKDFFPGRDDAIAIVYHDPAWMGAERTKESLRRHSARLHFQGSRNFTHLYYESAVCNDGGVWDENMPKQMICPVCRGTGKGNWRIPNLSKEHEGVAVNKLPEEAFTYQCATCWGSGDIVWRPYYEGDREKFVEWIADQVERSELSWQDLGKLQDREYLMMVGDVRTRLDAQAAKEAEEKE